MLADFAKLELSARLLKHEVGQHLLLLATDSDPQIYLPVIETLGEDPYRLELTLQVQSATQGAVGATARGAGRAVKIVGAVGSRAERAVKIIGAAGSGTRGDSRVAFGRGCSPQIHWKPRTTEA